MEEIALYNVANLVTVKLAKYSIRAQYIVDYNKR